jgi:N-acetylneuraminate synthase
MRVDIIAEVGSVHDGSFGNACKLIEVATDCGADVVKFQTHIAGAETLRDAPIPSFFKSEPRYEYFERTGFSIEQWHKLKAKCDEQKIEFLSSPFSIEAVELLENVGVKRYKIPSGEVTNLPFLKVIAETGKPILLSSGMSSWDELDEAVNIIRKHQDKLTILQCTSKYPCPYEEVGLNVMLEMKERYNLPVGLSDHTLTNYSAFSAVTLGATVIEKHLTFSRKMYGSDARHSLEPNEFKDLAQGIRSIEFMLSQQVDKDEIANKMNEMKKIFQKSIVSIIDIPKGSVITKEMIGFKKPGTGIPANKKNNILGKRAKKDIFKDNLIKKEDFGE